MQAHRTEDVQGYEFKFSIILSVYNVEEFIEEAVESLVAQTLDFEQDVQLIMVDDGSRDGSGAICDRYGEKYPHNVVVVHKPNGGLCSARNEGLRHVKGRYVNFFDPDDILTPNTLADVYAFFEEHDAETDLVAIPLIYFGDMTGPHHLNNKFAAGSRVISLEKEPQFVQLSLASSFLKLEKAKELDFDPRLVIGEDAEQIVKILLDRPTLGVVNSCVYRYRRRGGSQVTAGSTKKGYYTDYVRCFSQRSYERAKAVYGYVPRFVQYAVMCDLQWRYTESELPLPLDAREYEEYRRVLDAVIADTEDEVIMAQRHLVIDLKTAILARKHGADKYVSMTPSEVYYGYAHRVDMRLSDGTVRFHFIEINEEEVRLSTRQILLGITPRVDEVNLLFGGQKIAAERISYRENKRSIGEAVSYFCIAEFSLPRALLTRESTPVYYTCRMGESCVVSKRVSFGRFFPISERYKSSYYYQNGVLLTHENENLCLCAATRRDARRAERRYCRELWQKNGVGERKAVVARRLAAIGKAFRRRPLWIISDRLNKAGDNGEAFFRHLKKVKPRGIDYRYAIGRCDDYRKLRSLGHLIDRNSKRYKLLYLMADVIISSHADEFVLQPFHEYMDLYKDVVASKPFVFLQHGVTKDDISGWLNKYSKNFRGFVAAAVPEAESLISNDYFYTEREIWLTGFARFDRLYHNEKKRITLMPTWRRYLMQDHDPLTGVWSPSAGFTDSAYYRFYNSLINDARLLSACEQYGYTLCFLPHPNIIPSISLFDHDPRVHFYSLADEYRDVYAESDLVLTDYSSAVFDFAYLRKPMVYTHFDKKEFFGGSHVYTEGYFDYERDGFGEVTYSLEETVDLLIEYMREGCPLKEEYRRRIDGFFAFSDQENSARILDKILQM